MKKCDNSPHHRVFLKDIGVTKRYPVYYCVDCGHFIPERMILGRTIRCWNCDTPFKITPPDLSFKKLRCCSKQEAEEKRKQQAKELSTRVDADKLIASLMEGIDLEGIEIEGE